MKITILNIVLMCLVSCSLSGQEICDNAIDDDGDGLIDLNDDECDCLRDNYKSLLFEFEDYSCCPFDPGLAACLDKWVDASNATPDYLNTCDYTGGNFSFPFVPLPMPSGRGCVGMWITDNYGEYIGTCLSEPLVSGESYNVSFYMGFNNSASYESSSPFKFALYGATDCSIMPTVTKKCIGIFAQWTELTTFKAVGADSSWVHTSSSFISPGNFQAIAIGPACDANFVGNDYHFVDDFKLSGPFGNPPEIPIISQSGDCISGVVLTANHAEAVLYQWFLDGIALIGEVNEHLLIDYPNNGSYSVIAYTAAGCRVSKPTLVNIDPESLLFDSYFEDISCFGYQDGFINITNINAQNFPISFSWDDSGSAIENYENLGPGNYTVTLTDINGCFGIETFIISEPPPLEILLLPIAHPLSPSNIGCAEIVPIGGTPFYAVEWDNGDQDYKTLLEVGAHYVTVTDENNCQQVIEVVISPPLSVIAVADKYICKNSCTGKIVLEPQGGSSPYDILWSNLETGDSLNNLCPGVYTATITDANTTSFVIDIDIETYQNIVLQDTVSNIICPNTSSGFINTSITSGVYPITYDWSVDSDSISLDHISSGSYDLTITDGNMCTYEYQYNISESLPIKPYYGIRPAECGQNNGAIILDSIQGLGPFNYVWSTGDSTASISNITSGDYFVTILDASKCIHNDTVSISNTNEPIISVDVKDNSCPDGQNGAISITNVDGSGSPFFYSWSTGDSIRRIDSLAPGKYFLTVTYGNDCISVNEYNIGQLSSIHIDSSIIDEVCLGNNDGQIDVTINAGFSPYMFNWNNGDSTGSINNLSPGDYNLTIIDSLGCQYSYAYNIEKGGVVSAIANIKPTSCANDDDGIIAITPLGISPFIYVWDNGTITKDNPNLSAGNYNLLIEDSLGCTENYTFEIIDPPPIEIIPAITHPGCEISDSTGSIVLNPIGGSGLLDITWDFGSKDAIVNNLDPGDYIVTITDGNSCELIDSFEIVEGTPLIGLGIIDSIDCAGGFGNINIDILQGRAPYTYLWNDGVLDSFRIGLANGSYFVHIEDRSGCTDTLFFELTDPSTIDIKTIQNTSPTSAGNDGIIEIIPTGGTPPYQINWDNGVSGPLIDNLSFGNYTATVIDAKGCVEIVSFSFNPLPLSVNYDISDNLCFGDCLGFIDLNIAGGISPYSYSWSNGSADSTLLDLCQGLYSVTIQDALGATFEFNDLEIISPPQIISSIALNDISCIGLDDGSIYIMPSGGNGPYNLYLNNVLVSQNNNNLSPDIYTVSIIDDNGCQVDKLVTINELTPLSSDVTYSNIDCDNATGSILITSDNSDAYPILLDGQNIGSANEIIVDDLSPGVYQLSYMINDGCIIDIDDFDIIDETAIAITASPTFISTNSGTEFNINIEIDDLQGLISDITWNDINGDITCVDYNIDNHCILLILTLNQSDTLIITTLLTNGCLKEFIIPIDIIQTLDFDFPNTFSPNNDGINDEFNLSFLPDKVTIQQFEVFDRWGNKVFHFDNNLPKKFAAWDGKSNGSLVSQGVYVYIVSISNEIGETKFYKGDITIIR